MAGEGNGNVLEAIRLTLVEIRDIKVEIRDLGGQLRDFRDDFKAYMAKAEERHEFLIAELRRERKESERRYRSLVREVVNEARALRKGQETNTVLLRDILKTLRRQGNGKAGNGK